MKQSIDECAAIALVFGGTGSGVDHHAGGLVDDGEVGIFIEDVERDFFCDGTQRRPRRRGHNRHALATAKFQGGSGRFIVHEHFLLGDELLDARAAHVEAQCQELVEALAGVFGHDRNRWWQRFRHSQLDNTTNPLRHAGNAG